MKVILLISLVLLSACGKVEIGDPSDSGNETRKFDQQPLQDSDLRNIQAICSSLVNKESVLNILVASRNDYVFSYAERGCEATELSAAKDIVTKIVGEGLYYFKPQNGETFSFSNVETKSNGIMAAICANPYMSPMQTSPDTAIWFTTATSKHCGEQENSVCVHISRGTYKSNGDYLIHTNEWARFKVSGERQGFFTYRKLTSSVTCKEGKTMELQTTLK